MAMALNNPVILLFPEVNKISCKPVNFGKSSVNDLESILADLGSTCNRYKALGLAANQLGYNKQIFVWRNRKDILGYMVNPHIVQFSKDRCVIEEACLSLPNEKYWVKRYKQIKMYWYDVFGKCHFYQAKGAEAFVLQHEFDHLYSVCIKDKNCGSYV